jgi:hypothetical protein
MTIPVAVMTNSTDSIITIICTENTNCTVLYEPQNMPLTFIIWEQDI